MKRYDLTLYFDDFERPTAIVGQKSQGRYVCAADLQAWALKLKATVEGMEHSENCNSLICVHCCYSKDWVLHRHSEFREGGHEFKSNECTCPRGKVLAMLEVA